MRKRDEQVIDKPRPEADAGKLRALIVRYLHLRKQKTGAAEILFFMALGRTAAVKAPIPEREHNNVRQPKQTARAQECERRFFVRRKRLHQKEHRTDQRKCRNSIDEIPESAIK